MPEMPGTEESLSTRVVQALTFVRSRKAAQALLLCLNAALYGATKADILAYAKKHAISAATYSGHTAKVYQHMVRLNLVTVVLEPIKQYFKKRYFITDLGRQVLTAFKAKRSS